MTNYTLNQEMFHTNIEITINVYEEQRSTVQFNNIVIFIPL